MKLSADELQKQQLHPATLELAVQQIRNNGVFTFESVLPPDLIAAMQAAYTPIYEKFIQNPGQTFGKNHYRVYLPFTEPFNDLRVICSPFVMPIMEALLGADFVCHYFATNTCAPGSELQPVHSDYRILFPEADVAVPPFMLVLNIPLVDVTTENGPVQYFPGGTHRLNIPFGSIDPIAAQMHSEYATMPAGSIMLRDGQMWHRGTTNRSHAPRPQIAIVYSRPWVDMGTHIAIPRATYDALPENARHIFRDEHIS
jgi:Phytanoyl-CoA dioxygenase (PhyH)